MVSHGLIALLVLAAVDPASSAAPSGPAMASNRPAPRYNPIRQVQAPTSHEMPFNQTHTYKCRLTPRCKNREVEYSMHRSSWWHCGGDMAACMSRLHRDMLYNLEGGECTSGRCFRHPMPEHIASLRNLTLSTCAQEGRDSQEKFSGAMELMANVIVQKARFCRFDIDMFARLVGLLNKETQRYRQRSSSRAITYQNQATIQRRTFYSSSSGSAFSSSSSGSASRALSGGAAVANQG